MANEKCVLDIMESKGYIEIMNGARSRKEFPEFYIRVNDTIKDGAIRKEISQNQVRNFPSLIKSHILPYFANVNTLIDTIYEES